MYARQEATHWECVSVTVLSLKWYQDSERKEKTYSSHALHRMNASANARSHQLWFTQTCMCNKINTTRFYSLSQVSKYLKMARECNFVDTCTKLSSRAFLEGHVTVCYVYDVGDRSWTSR